ncbi:unnamed protein product [Kuraishia capsulata CBS 1993]|uniref:Glycosyltransferase family 15 protein n=1 Tax=Kuraishia capsulata CBS 1993 TaxID=1382522 RepID=W6MNP5_9ASCO|nr:uncharacterized protein KUCA_T00002656001 [Kuraishia capsulata CBS 1993]CDK26682.1 unnamed protein product [Kuraishia capsulata CBS 1993]
MRRINARLFALTGLVIVTITVLLGLRPESGSLNKVQSFGKKETWTKTWAAINPQTQTQEPEGTGGKTPEHEHKDENKESAQRYVPGDSSKLEQAVHRKQVTSKAHRQNATLLALVRNSETYGMIKSIKQLEDRFNHKFNYDWVFLNEEPFDEEFINETSMLVSGTARYGNIPKEHWSYPDWIDQDVAKKIRESRVMSRINYGSSESYRHMCRFNSGFFYKHPIMDDYQFYWRVEPDIMYNCDIPEDPFKFMVDNRKQYGFVVSMYEAQKTVETLWETSMKHFNQSGLPPADPRMYEFIAREDNTYNLCHFWSNFEIANLDFYRDEKYERFFNALDWAGGFFYERWGDAPVHTIAVAMLLKAEEVHVFQDISYTHTVAETCPLDDGMRHERRCVCNPHTDFSWKSKNSCTPRFVQLTQKETLKDHDRYVTAFEQEERDEKLRKLQEEEKQQAINEQRQKDRRRKAEQRKAQRQAEREKKAKEKAQAEGKGEQKQEQKQEQKETVKEAENETVQERKNEGEQKEETDESNANSNEDNGDNSNQETANEGTDNGQDSNEDDSGFDEITALDNEDLLQDINF